MDTFNLITSLKIISMIREGQKVSIRHGNIHMDRISEGLSSSIKRWYYQDSRYKTYNFIRNLIMNALGFYKNLPTDHEEYDLLEKSLYDATIGISNLKITYGEDASIVAAFEVLEDRINRALKN